MDLILNTLEELKSGSLQGCTRLQLVEALTEFPKNLYPRQHIRNPRFIE